MLKHDFGALFRGPVTVLPDYIETGTAVAGSPTDFLKGFRVRLQNVEVKAEEQPDVAARAEASSANGGEEEKIPTEPQIPLMKISLDLKTAVLVCCLFLLSRFCSSALETEAAGKPHASQGEP
jgi:hypothetical protein